MASILGITSVLTTAYHVQSNGMIERVHRTLKESLVSRSLCGDSSWASHLPLVLLGLRSTVREDARCCPADVVYGCQLRLPGDLMDASPVSPDVSPFVADLQAAMASLRPLLPVQRASRDIGHVPSALARTSHVFLRVAAVRRSLTPPYDGPFPVLQRGEKTFKILKGNKEHLVSIDRLKPAFLDVLPVSPAPAPAPAAPVATPLPSPPLQTRSGHRVNAPHRYVA